MLILTRRRGQSLVVGNEVVITVTQIGPQQVRIGIEAPRATPIVRKEILERSRLSKPSTPIDAAGKDLCLTAKPRQL